MDGEVHLLTGEDGVAEMVVDRPAKHNAVTPPMAAAIAAHAAAADADGAVRCILLRGAGDRAFCSGTDLNALAAYPDTWAFRNRVEYSTSVRNIRKPVVVAMKGWALGGGFEMALAADIRVAARSLKAGFPEVTRGWVGGGGASQMLPRLVGYGQAMRLLLTGETVGAEEARALGMVEVLAEDADHEEVARGIARRIAAFSPVATQSVKASVRMAMQAPLPAGLAYENEMNVLCFAAGDHLEGIRAFAERREAAFKR
jgi:enoyl-CoA hydratase/carnithine racemase